MEKTIIFCSIVRDCYKNLNRNIPVIEKIGSHFKDYSIIVFENNSKDNTKDALEKWERCNKNVKVFCNNFDESKYKNIPLFKEYPIWHSRRRIQKMTDYRNLYMDYIQSNNLQADYVCITDLDVAGIDVGGVLSSFELPQKWDAVTASGYSRNIMGQKRFHDTYAFIEDGLLEAKQSRNEILKNRFRLNFLKKGLPLLRVSSSYGGLGIYKFEAIKNLRYRIIENNFQEVEVLSEHISLHKQMIENGFDKIYINPNMIIEYEHLNLQLIFQKFKNRVGQE
jgi:hypothetical protein